MVDDHFSTLAPTIVGPAMRAFAVTPDDDADLEQNIRAVTIGTTGGTLTFVSSRTGATSTTAELPIGTYPLFASRILSTGTTATGITGWV